MRTSTSEETPDDELVRRGATDATAFQILYDRYARRVFGLLATMRIDPHTADDVAQQAWVKAWKGLATKPPNSPFAPWLMQIVRNAAIDQQRRKKLAAIPEDAQFAADGPASVLHDVEENAEMERLRECIRKLPDVERTIFQHRLEGMDSPTIATKLGLTTERVHRLFHDAKHKLQRDLGVRT